jgi:hypothetical protein
MSFANARRVRVELMDSGGALRPSPNPLPPGEGLIGFLPLKTTPLNAKTLGTPGPSYFSTNSPFVF